MFALGNTCKVSRGALSLLEHVEVLRLSCCSHGNRQAAVAHGTRIWRASSDDNSTIYVALFNVVGDVSTPSDVSVTLAELEIPCSWTGGALAVRGVLMMSNATVKSLKPGATSLSLSVNRHGTRLVAVTREASKLSGGRWRYRRAYLQGN